MKYCILFIFLVITYHFSHGQEPDSIVRFGDKWKANDTIRYTKNVDDFWSGVEIDFPIITSHPNNEYFKRKGISEDMLEGWTFNGGFGSKKELLTTKLKLGFGEIENYKMQFPYNAELSINRFIFHKIVNFTKSTFQLDAYFHFSKFYKEVYFYSTKFKQSSGFNSCDFLSAVHFENDTFSNQVEFRGTSFGGDVYFTNSTFFNKCNFTPYFVSFHRWIKSPFSKTWIYHNQTFMVSSPNTRFLKEVHFWMNSFFDDVDFSNVIFSNGAYFSGTKFYKNVKFDHVIFSKKVSFFRTIFFAPLYFGSSSFHSSVDFSYAQLPDTIFFSDVNLDSIRNNIDFNNALVDSLRMRSNNPLLKCKIFLNNTDISKVIIDPSKFELAFENNLPYDVRLSIYEQVIKKCKDEGLEESAENFDIEFQKFQIHHEHNKFSSIIIWIYEYWWNFGYNRSKIFRNTLFAFLLFFILFFSFMKYFCKVYLPRDIGVKSDEIPILTISSFTSFLLRFKIAIFYTAIVFFSWRIVHEDVKYRKYPWGALIIYIVFIIGIIHLAYLAGFVIAK
ncbi:MAG: pentapeptide repeat-containing protein [Bacteroidales bacterium]|nr:pentapeptide repeat-containing protein [Bacteroidales bacterium]